MRGQQEIPTERLGHFAPALAKDLSNLPPAFIAVGSLDLFAEEAAAYAMRLNLARVPAEFHLYPGGIHGFDLTHSSIARQYRMDLAMALNRIFGKAAGGDYPLSARAQAS
jgi:triacylglycerol lipase